MNSECVAHEATMLDPILGNPSRFVIMSMLYKDRKDTNINVENKIIPNCNDGLERENSDQWTITAVDALIAQQIARERERERER